MEMKNVFYFHSINSIGGVETFFYNIARKYEEWDITVIYQIGDPRQVERLARYVRIRKYKGEEIYCKKAFFNYNVDIIDHVHAEEYIQIVHADLKAMGMKLWIHPKITKLLGVSQHVCDVVKEMSGRDAELAYNPVIVDIPKKILRLVSATRLTFEKGRERIIKLAGALDKEKIPYRWEIYTDSQNPFQNSNIVLCQSRLDISDVISDADYLVQLSSAEGYCFSVVESLMLGTPVIVTDLPVYKELGLNEKNSFILPMDMSGIPAGKIYKGLPKFKYTPPDDRWDEILAEGPSTYGEDQKRKVELRAIVKYYDLQLNRLIQAGEVITTNAVRAAILIEKDLCEEVNHEAV